MQDKDDLFERRLNDYISGMITDEEKVELFSLAGSSELYRLQYNKAVKLHALLHVPVLEARKGEGYRRFSQRIQGEPGRKKNQFVIWVRFAAAAVVLMVLTSALSIYIYENQYKSDKDILCETIVPFGSQTKIILPDSSVVVLNSGSVLKYPATFEREERNVYLAGEGYFKVAKDKDKVFQVYAGDARIQVTGTVFNVRSYPEERESATLAEGSIQLEMNRQVYRIVPGQQAYLQGQEVKIKEVDLEHAIAWRHDAFSFKEEPLGNIMNELSRWYDVHIFYLNPAVKDLHFTAWFRRNSSLEEVIDILKKTQKINVELKGKTLTVREA